MLDSQSLTSCRQEDGAGAGQGYIESTPISSFTFRGSGVGARACLIAGLPLAQGSKKVSGQSPVDFEAARGSMRSFQSSSASPLANVPGRKYGVSAQALAMKRNVLNSKDPAVPA
jgi:hypothetical protein